MCGGEGLAHRFSDRSDPLISICLPIMDLVIKKSVRILS